MQNTFGNVSTVIILQVSCLLLFPAIPFQFIAERFVIADARSMMIETFISNISWEVNLNYYRAKDT